MMSQMLLAIFHYEFEISVPKTLLRIVAVVALIGDLGQLVLMNTMMHIGSSQVIMIGIEPPAPRPPATLYSY